MTGSWHRDWQQMLRNFAETFGGLEDVTARGSEWLPAADVLTKGEDLLIRLELPGIDPERDLEITAEDGTVRIRGERRESEEVKEEGYIRRESFYGSFERALRLPSGVTAEDLKASYEDGILEILVPGAAKRAAQRIPIEVGGRKKK